MLYIVFSFVVALLALLALLEWKRTRTFGAKRLSKKLLAVKEQLALNQWEGAERLLKPLREGYPDHLDVLVITAQFFTQTGQYEAAIEVIDQALTVDPGSLIAVKEQAKLLLHQGKPGEALKAFQICQPLLREDEDLLALATAYFMEERPDWALETLEPLLEGSENGSMLALAGDCLFAKGEKKAALCLYERATRVGLYNASITTRKGHCLKHLGRYKEAIRSFTSILQRDSANVAVTISLASCYEALGQYPTALFVYQQGKAWETQDVRLLKGAGIAAIDTQKYEDGIEHLRAALLKGEHSTKALVYLGYGFECMGRWEEAEAIYLQAASDHPHHPAGFRGLAWLFGVGRSRSLDSEQGLEMARRSLTLLPDPISWEVLSACEARAGNFDTAHQIQEHLSQQEGDANELVRRKAAMRALRRQVPLDEHQVARSLVA